MEDQNAGLSCKPVSSSPTREVLVLPEAQLHWNLTSIVGKVFWD